MAKPFKCYIKLATGIDRGTHKRLIEELTRLAEGKQSEYWKEVLSKLQSAYQETNLQLSLAVQHTILYNDIQAIVRSEVASELRLRKRKNY